MHCSIIVSFSFLTFHNDIVIYAKINLSFLCQLICDINPQCLMLLCPNCRSTGSQSTIFIHGTTIFIHFILLILLKLLAVDLIHSTEYYLCLGETRQRYCAYGV